MNKEIERVLERAPDDDDARAAVEIVTAYASAGDLDEFSEINQPKVASLMLEATQVGYLMGRGKILSEAFTSIHHVSCHKSHWLLLKDEDGLLTLIMDGKKILYSCVNQYDFLTATRNAVIAEGFQFYESTWTRRYSALCQ